METLKSPPKEANILKSLHIALCSSLVTVSLGLLSASAAETISGLTSLKEQARELAAPAAEPAEAAPEAPSWESVTVETPGSEEQGFWEELSEDTFRGDICERIALPIEYGYEAENTGSVAGSVNRGFRRYLDRTLALVDETGLKLELGGAKTLLELGEAAGVSIEGGVRFEGSSIVIRPLGGKKSCKELGHLLNVLKYKTVMPLKAARFAAMQTGEIWKIPLTLWTGFTPTVSGGYGNVGVSVSFGVENQRLPSVSLYKMSDKELRVRLRIDQARIVSYGVSLEAAAAPLATGLDELSEALSGKLGRVVGEVAGGIIAEKFEDYTYASLGLTHSSTKGRKVVLEFILDPRDKEQMETLEKLLKEGELSMVGALAKTAVGFNLLPGHNNVNDTAELRKMQARWNEKLGIEPAYSGQNGYRESSNEFTLHLPILSDYSHASGHNHQQIRTPGSDDVLHVYENSTERTHDLLRIPLVGSIFKHNREKSVAVMTNEEDGKPSAPIMVYGQVEGMIRHSDISARKMLDGVNEIMRYVGARGEDYNSPAAIPVETLQPLKPDTIDPGTGERVSDSDIYKSAFMSFEVVFNENAVQTIINTPADMLIKAFANSLEAGSRDIMKKVLSVSEISAGGEIRYKERDLRKVLGGALDMLSDGQNDLMSRISSFCSTAARLVTDVVRIRTAGGIKAQSEMLSKVMAGGGKSGLAYADILKVLVQAVEPKDVAAEILYQTEKKVKGQDDVSVKYVYNADNDSFENAEEYQETAEHFDEAGQLTD